LADAAGFSFLLLRFRSEVMVFGKTAVKKPVKKSKNYAVKQETEVTWTIGEYFWVKVNRRGTLSLAETYIADILEDNTPEGDAAFDVLVSVLKEAKGLSKQRQEVFEKEKRERKEKVAQESAARASSGSPDDEEEDEDEDYEDLDDEDEGDEY
jgi:hypothetical protein